MNNTDKLLRAFIEVSGYEIETVLDYKEVKMPQSEAMRHNTPWGAATTEYQLVSSKGCMLDIDEDGLYTARLREPIVDYKVTKKEVDYKEMLSKYIDYIECREGTNFLSDADDDDFSTEELKAIRGL